MLSSNPGKKLVIKVKGKKFVRYPVRTHFIQTSDNLDNIIKQYVLPLTQKADIIVLCQKIISILQARVVQKKEVKVGYFAKFLSKFVKKTPYGFSVGNPLKMQLAIQLAGLPRIFLAALIGGFFKIFKIYGVFYHLAGNQVNQIDGFYGEVFPQYAEIGILGPKNCNQLCKALREEYGLSFVIADVNDLGGNILGSSQDLQGKEKLILEILRDNPAGQENFQTPIIIIRPIYE